MKQNNKSQQDNLRNETFDDVITAGSYKILTYEERLKILQSRKYNIKK